MGHRTILACLVVIAMCGGSSPAAASDDDVLYLEHVDTTDASEAVRVYLARLAEHPSRWTLRDIAVMGPRARDAGPAVLALLDHPDPDVRAAAARTLGYLRYPAVGQLLSLLAVPDIHLNRVAAESLGRIGDRQALPALGAATRDHWYPPVRAAAADAVRHVTSGEPYPPADTTFLDYVNFRLPDCDAPPDAPRLPEPGKLHAAQGDDLQAFAYQDVLLDLPPPPDDPDAPPLLVRRVPNVVLPVGDGWLLGSDRGEFGGELVHRARDGSTTRLLQENVHDIFRVGNRIIAVTGIAHMIINRGMLVDVSPSGEGGWVATPWRRLPGQPEASWRVSDDELLVKTRRGGTIIASSNGDMRMADCPERRVGK